MAEKLITQAAYRTHGHSEELLVGALQQPVQRQNGSGLHACSKSAEPSSVCKSGKDYSRPRLPKHRSQYARRKGSGLCAYYGCTAKPEVDRQYCHKHLKSMSRRRKIVVSKRKNESLCVYCGLRPQFWSVHCVICRQRFCKDPLPNGARRALRLYREAEEQFEIELIQVRARLDARKLLASGDLNRDQAKALSLFAGLDSAHWRSYGQVGRLMGLSKERVRQLLQPSKSTLALSLKERVPAKQS